MRQRREHVIGACSLNGEEDPDSFSHIVNQSKDNFNGRELLAKDPPPEREIYIKIKLAKLEDLSSVFLVEYFGLAFDVKVLFTGGGVILRRLSLLNGIVERILRDNKSIRYYGIKLSLFAEESNEEDRSEIFTFLNDWCEEKRAELGVAFVFDIARDSKEFNHIMANEHLRMKHGDIKRQFAIALNQQPM